MFCPACGFEYTQKTNYCKRCGESLGVTSGADAPKAVSTRLSPVFLTAMFCAVAAFGIIGLAAVFAVYDNLVMRGVRGSDLRVPLVMGLMFTGSIAGLLIWQLSRMISAFQKTGQSVIVEKHYIREATPAQLSAPTGSIQQTVGPSSVVEHTTRQMAGRYRESN